MHLIETHLSKCESLDSLSVLLSNSAFPLRYVSFIFKEKLLRGERFSSAEEVHNHIYNIQAYSIYIYMISRLSYLNVVTKLEAIHAQLLINDEMLRTYLCMYLKHSYITGMHPSRSR